MNRNTIITKLPTYLVNTLLLIFCIYLVLFVIALISGEPTKINQKTVGYSSALDSKPNSNTPNLVTSGLSSATNTFNRSMHEAGAHISTTGSYALETARDVGVSASTQTARVVTSIVKQSASFLYNTAKFTFNAVIYIIKNVALAGKTVAGFVIGINAQVYGFILERPVSAIGSIITEPKLSRYVTPSEYIADAPLIDPYSPEINKAITTLAEENNTSPEVKSESTPEFTRARWPLEGRITTQFGVPHWPYQPVHTGLDISDRTASGITPIFPFRAGTVIKTISSNRGLGNYVEVDHGNGITSVYAHLASITVINGQSVTTATEIGRQGTTGVSTGVHLHFEIRINGQATDPLPFINS